MFCLSARLPSGVFRSNFPIRLGSPLAATAPLPPAMHGACGDTARPRASSSTPSPSRNNTPKERENCHLGAKGFCHLFPYFPSILQSWGKNKTKQLKFIMDAETLFFFFSQTFHFLSRKRFNLDFNTNSLVVVRKMLLPPHTHLVSKVSPRLHPCSSYHPHARAATFCVLGEGFSLQKCLFW